MAGLPDDHAAALHESAEDLYQHAPCGYLTTVPDGTIVRVNDTFLAWSGHEREQLVGRRRFADLLSPGGRIYHETHYAPLLRMQHTVREIALEIVCADGRRLPVLVNSVLRNDADGRPLAIHTTVFNATDRKEYERELLRARERERSARRRTERLQHVTAALAAALEPREIAAAVLETIVEGAGADEAVFAAIEGHSARLDVLASHGSSSPVLDAWRERGLRQGLPAAAALASGEPLLVHDPPDGVPLARPAETLAAIPLMLGERSVGLITLAFAARAELGDEDRELVVAVARQAAQALERARLHEQTRRAARRSELLAEAAHVLNQAQGLTERAQLLVELIVPRLADAALVEVSTEEGRRTVAVTAVDEGTRAQVLRLAHGTTGGGADADAAATVRYAPRAGRERSVHGEAPFAATLPLRARGRSVGALILAAAGERAESGDRALFAELAERAALALENARLYEREHQIAHAMQRSLLAGGPARDERFTVATRYLPGVEALQVGGDWHDAFTTAPGRLVVVVGDVVGHGLEAASAMGQLRSALRALAGVEGSPGRVLDRLDRFVDHFGIGMAATVAVADIDLGTGTMRYACAGHPPPVLIAPDAPPRLLWEGRSPPLGASFGLGPRRDAEIGVRAGARVVLYTDGLIERRRRVIDEGLDVLLAELTARTAMAPQRLVDELAATMVDAEAAKDDVCLLCLEFGPSPAQPDELAP